MDLDMTFKRMEQNPRLKRYAEEKTLKLKKYFNGKINVHWNLGIEKQSRVAKCHINGKSIDYVGEGKSETFFSAIDDALTKIERQLKKKKELVKHNKHHAGKKVA